MNARTKLSAKGQVVIPKEVRDALGLETGQMLEVLPVPGGVMLRKPFAKVGRSTEQVLKKLRAQLRYEGPPVPVEELGFPGPEEWRPEGKPRPPGP